MNNNIITVFP